MAAPGNEARERLVFLLRNHDYPSYPIGRHEIHIPAKALPKSTADKIVYEFHRFDEKERENKESIKQFKDIINSLAKGLGIDKPLIDIDYESDQFSLPTIKNMIFNTSNEYKNRNEFNEAIHYCFPDAAITISEDSANHCWTFEGCPTADAEKLKQYMSDHKTSNHTTFKPSFWYNGETQQAKLSKPHKTKPAKGKLKPEIKTYKADQNEPHWPASFRRFPGSELPTKIERSESRGNNWYSFFPLQSQHFDNEDQFTKFCANAKQFAPTQFGTQGIKSRRREPFFSSGLFGKSGYYCYAIKAKGKSGYARVYGQLEVVSIDKKNLNVIIFDKPGIGHT